MDAGLSVNDPIHVFKMKIKRGFWDILLTAKKRISSISRCSAKYLTLQRKCTENILALITGCIVRVQVA
jgi:hypothetical protein